VLHRSADAYIANGRRGTIILAGYPWFADWGRDTFIAMRGLCLSTGRLDDARSILTNWAGQVSEGMLPNRFPDDGQAPEFNSVDASLWFIVAVHDFFHATGQANCELSPEIREQLWAAVEKILDGYSRGTRYRIQMDPADGLLPAGEPGMQLTWMDARVGDREITPRIGKPVEIQALWINALWIAREKFPRFQSALEMARDSFLPLYWNAAAECLLEVIDCDHQPGRNDSSLRQNQLFALGGLPFPLVDADHACRALAQIESKLFTAVGLRSLSPDDPRYIAHYEGGVAQRYGSYHQGTVWPFLMAAFVEAWLRVHGNTAETRTQAAHDYFFHSRIQ
jgi:predicted glycogen debranching enzyme